ncbi:MAG: molybdopterin-dependent oxidoreductase [Eggerthellaceae bacterium]|nr:molybdopterin-dependent oxidoreductase [Eggerthellaceae bacterium]
MTPHIHADADPVDKGRSKGCLRGMSMMETLYNERRVKYPLRRVEGTPRGGGEWERISWDDALDEIADKWKGYIEEYGGKSIVRWSIYGTAVVLNGHYGSWPKLCTILGISNFLAGADQAMMFTLGQYLGGSYASGCDGPSVAQNARNIIIWGANPAETSPHEFRYMQEARDRGATLTLIDPRITATSAKSQKQLRIRPATDSALGLAVINYLIENDRVDWEFLAKSTTAPFLVKSTDGKYLRSSDYGTTPTPTGLSNRTTGVMFTDDPAYVWDNAQNKAVLVHEATDPAFTGTFTVEVDGQPVSCTTALSLLQARASEWPLERAAELCDVSEQQIIELAEAMADGPTVFNISNGLGHTVYSHSAYMVAATCAAITGNFLKPGAGISHAGVTTSLPWIPISYDQYVVPPDSKPGPTYSSLKFPDIMETGTYNGEDAPIKSILVVAGNPLSNVPDRQAMLKAWEKVEFTITVDPIMTETAMYSDLVLPAAQWLEEEDAGVAMFTPYTPFGEKCVEPSFEHRTDFDIAKALALRFGLDPFYQKTEEEVTAEIYQTAINGISGGAPVDVNGEPVTRDRLVKEKTIRTLEDGYYDQYFLTQDYRIALYLEAPDQLHDYGEKINVDDKRLPFFQPPAEAWPETVGGFEKNPLAEKYPLIFLTAHSRYRTHTTTGYNPWLLELQNGPDLHMNQVDAEARGLQHGDIVKVYNDRGFVAVQLCIDNSLRPGMVNLPHGWQADQFIAGHYQDLTSRACDPFDCNDNYFDCLCEVEKYEEV